MAVYDWGEDGVPFMVLELLAGGSLRSMLDAGNRLSPAQSAHVGGQVAGALDYAHGRGLVHRDIKPANLLFDEHGIVRVADFGLARALAEASWTEPAGAVVGTARYAAPEQGSGAPLDGRADLYALGLVMVESVTGSVPLVGDSPLGTIGLRQERAITVGPELGALAPVLTRVCSADPDDRYPTADAMRIAIDEVAERMPPPGPLVLAGLGAVGEDPHPTQVVRPVRELSLFDQDQPKGAPAADPRRPAWPGSRAAPGRPRRSCSAPSITVLIAAAAFVLARPERRADDDGPAARSASRGRTRSRPPSTRTCSSTGPTRRVRRPPGNGDRPEPGAGWLPRRADDGAPRAVEGPGPGAAPRAAGPDPGRTRPRRSRRSSRCRSSTESDDTVPKGTVISSIPTGAAAPDSTVQLIVSTGPPLVVVPEVSGRSYDAAVARLREQRVRRGTLGRLQRHGPGRPCHPHRSRGGPEGAEGLGGHGPRQQGPGPRGRPRLQGQDHHRVDRHLARPAGVGVADRGAGWSGSPARKVRAVRAQAPRGAGGKVEARHRSSRSFF